MSQELCKGLIKIHVKNASNLNPDPLYSIMKFSHPVLVERLKALNFHPSTVHEEDDTLLKESKE